ncbi:biorientation of chromosomes in cell division protein 1-like 1 isoform X1 [Dendroctonus ponderosae]|uniref:BOD1/SHG1 domain-containing protein n=1 Tax=Dendroctonus ponderosae TaxID=77166 RepID=U4U8K1_DENPD|nr:biorientation of chromosomes in cell division protein 1-like 1 isoform X1 [Dendroctonus ponderosae]ERL86275.1 hypothetical protein D910_03684 [Dendroctonus ponderosae]KAH1017500.1 hypothetical protein HUJ05_008129 [Dendroctonus ponderosae]KAH1017501.1 hypothetical protein HUJ05_008129 [Dendroctonus ponderosae]
MDMLPSSCLPGDPRLINHIVYELKSQGIFDQFRKECIADVDTKPAYQNLSQRVEGSVMNFLKKQKFAESINKNQLREQLRKNITESGFLESGVERIVDQVVNPKINSVFLPKVEDVVYRFLGIERPSQEAQRSGVKPKIENLFPQDLDAASPKSAHDEKMNDVDKTDSTEALNSSEAKMEDESPSFEPLEESKFSAQEENSDDSHLSGMSGLSRNSKKNDDVEMSTSVQPAQDISQQSEAVVASEQDTTMEICTPSEISDACDNTMEKLPDKTEAAKPPHDGDSANVLSALAQDKPGCKSEKSGQEDADGKKADNYKRSHDRHKSSSRSDKREHKEKKERSKSESKSKDHKEKTSSKHSSSNKDKDKDGSNIKGDNVETDKAKKEDKERHKSRTSSSSKSKDYKTKSEKPDKSKEKSEKDKERTHKDKDRPDKDQSSTDKGNKPEKSKSSKDKEKAEKSRVEKAASEKDKSSKIAKEKSSNSSKTENKDKASSSKENGPPSSNTHSNLDKSSAKSSKDKPKSSSTSNSKDKDKKVDDPKQKSAEKHKKKDKSSSSSDKLNLSSRKDKEKKSSDDHYSFKDKKSTRRSTDRDSNDGSSKVSRHDSTTETGSNSYKGSSKESSEVFSSGGGESSNSENVEKKPEGDEVVKSPNAEASPFKYLKPKFASNIHEAMKLMKIRKQLAKMERENKLALTAVSVNEKEKAKLETETESVSTELKTDTILNSPEVKQSSKKPESPLKNILKLQVQLERKVEETQNAEHESSPVLKSHDISLESFAALEARLALEMSTVNSSSYGYGDDEDYAQYSSITTSPHKQRKLSEKQEIYHSLFEESAPNSREAQIDQSSLHQIVTASNLENSVACSQASKTRTFVLDQNSDEEIELAGGIQSKSRIREPDSILRTVLLNTAPSEIPILAEKSQNSPSYTVDFLGFSNVDREDVASNKLHELLEQVGQDIFGLQCKAELPRLVKKAAAQSSDYDHNFGGSIKRMNGKKLFISLEKTELDTKMLPLKSITRKEITPLNGGFEPANLMQNGQKKEVKESTPLKINRLVKEWENDDIPCCFFDKPDAADITNLNRLIERLAANIEKQLEKIANSSSTIIKQTCKRKLQDEERVIEPKFAIKRQRLNEIILDENMCNASLTLIVDLPSHQNFNFPLSPAESEKSGEQKKDEPTPVKHRKSARGSTSQRYSTDELYKPRPVLGCSGSRRKYPRRDSMEQS